MTGQLGIYHAQTLSYQTFFDTKVYNLHIDVFYLYSSILIQDLSASIRIL